LNICSAVPTLLRRQARFNGTGAALTGARRVAKYDAGVTTRSDHGKSSPSMLRCPLEEDEHLFRSLVLTLRDMRCANQRDPETGDGQGNTSWIGLAIGMIVLDTLSGDSKRCHGRRRLTGADSWVISVWILRVHCHGTLTRQ
jgi:hypothetical protein